MERLEINADADRVVDARAVIELERGHCRIRIDRAKFRRELLVVAQVDLRRRHGNTLLGEKNTNPSRARGGGAIVEFHAASVPVTILVRIDTMKL